MRKWIRFCSGRRTDGDGRLRVPVFDIDGYEKSVYPPNSGRQEYSNR